MTLQITPPTGSTPWPFIVLAGEGKHGKTFAALHAGTHDSIGNTYVVTFNQPRPDDYQHANPTFSIIEAERTITSLLAAIDLAVTQPATSGKPNLVIVDSLGDVWSYLTERAQHKQRQRVEKRYGRPITIEDDVTVTADLWNDATELWNTVINRLRRHHGPVIATAPLQLVTIMDAAGNPTKDKQWKITGQKRLRQQVDVVAEFREPRTPTFVNVGPPTIAAVLDSEPDRAATIYDLFTIISAAKVTTQRGRGTETVNAATFKERADAAQSVDELRAVWQAAGDYLDDTLPDGTTVREYITAKNTRLNTAPQVEPDGDGGDPATDPSPIR